MTGAGNGIAVIIVSYGSADDLPSMYEALLPQLGADDQLVVVDNQPGDGSADVTRRLAPNATIVEPQDNLGFAGGCNAGVAASSAPLVLLLNPDAVPAPGCLDALRAAADARPTWGAWQALVTMDGGTRINTAGNVVHALGFGWAGRCEEPTSAITDDLVECGFCSGAAMVVRRALWEQLGGFDERYFMYCEDLDLSLRIRLAGHGLGVVPTAKVEHGYVFDKGSYKWFLLERNRWWTILGTYPTRLLIPMLPWLLAFELLLLPAALRGGWLREKLRAQWAVVRLLPAMLRRRRAVQDTATISAADFAAGLVASLDSPVLAGAAAVPGVDASQRGLWRAVRATL